MSFNALVFDLDGTLLYTLPDIAAAANTMLERHGWPVHPEEAFRRFVGNGFVRLVQRAVPSEVLAALTPEELDALVNEGKALYSANLWTKTRPYEGIVNALRELRAMGLRLAVLSNKPDSQTAPLVEHFFPGLVDIARGARPGVPLKPAPAAVLGLLADMGSEPARACYVGDSDVDILTGLGAGMGACGVAWGFRGEEEVAKAGAMWLCRTPADLVSLARGILSRHA